MEEGTEKSTTTTGIGNIENINKNKDDKLSVTSSSAVPSSNGSGSKQSSSSMGKRRKGHKNSKKSSNPVPEHHSINYKNLDEWLESTIKGMNVGDNNSPAASASNIHQHPHLMNTNPFYPNMLPPYTGMRPWSDMNHLNIPNFASNTPYTNLSHSHMMNNNNMDFTSLPPMMFNNNGSNNIGGMDGSNKDTNSIRSSNHNIIDGGDHTRMFTGDPMPHHHQSSTPNLFSTNQTATLTTTSDDSDDTKESTDISKTSLKIEESETPNNNESSYMTHNNLNMDISVSTNNKLLMNLIKQINSLHETNTNIFRNLQETKVELEALKNAPSWGGLRHRRDSISGLSLHSQPLGPISGYHHGTQSPAPTYHSQGYTPGVVSDVIREVREGTRVREEALLNRVKNMIEERQWSINETNLRVVRELEELKIQIHQMKLDKKHSDDKISRLESELTSLRNMLTHSMSLLRPTTSTFESPSYLDPKESYLRYGLRTNQDPTKRLSLNFGTPMNAPDATGEQFNLQKRNGRGGVNDSENYELENSVDGQLVQLERDTLELRRELQDAIASKKASESKILALEKLVTSLKNRVPTPGPGQQSLTVDSNNYEQQQLRHSTSPQPQKAAIIQTVSPKSILTNSLSLNGPVTDL